MACACFSGIGVRVRWVCLVGKSVEHVVLYFVVWVGNVGVQYRRIIVEGLLLYWLTMRRLQQVRNMGWTCP